MTKQGGNQHIVVTQRLEALAPAKINPFLEVLGRRADGYHELETVFHTIDFSDRLWLQSGPAGLILHDAPLDCPPAEANLAWRAILAFHQQLGQPPACQLHLQKRIPAGAGLGGGSSDAATALQLCQTWHGQPLAQATLHDLAARLGADVPFFLRGGCAHGLGRGDRLQPLADRHGQPISLLLPGCSLATPRVFAALSDADRETRQALGPTIWHDRLPQLENHLFNRLTGAARSLEPSVDQLLRELEQQTRLALMSGSGSACFVWGHLDPAPAGARLIHTQLIGPTSWPGS